MTIDQVSPLEFARYHRDKCLQQAREWEMIISKIEGNGHQERDEPKQKKQIITEGWTEKIDSALKSTNGFMTGRQIFETVGDGSNYAAFSAALSNRVNRSDAVIVRYVVDTKDNSLKYWYGLKSWCDAAGKPLPQYKQAIMEQIK